MQSNDLPETGFVRLPAVLRVIPVSRSRWYQGVQRGEFPQPVHLGPRAVAWRAEDIRELISQLSERAA